MFKYLSQNLTVVYKLNDILESVLIKLTHFVLRSPGTLLAYKYICVVWHASCLFDYK
jgi:hypothetical protein